MIIITKNDIKLVKDTVDLQGYNKVDRICWSQILGLVWWHIRVKTRAILLIRIWNEINSNVLNQIYDNNR